MATHLHFDCFSGISGDMTLGALVDAGLPFKDLVRGLALLRIEGFRLTRKRVERGALTATKVDVLVEKGFRAPLTLAQIKRILLKSGLPPAVKEKSQAVFDVLAHAEGKAHGVEPSHVHFHEVGVIDSFVDVVGGVLGIHLLGVQRVTASAINVGSGTLMSAHGSLPVPGPAVAALAVGLPIYAGGLSGNWRLRRESRWCEPWRQNSVACLICRCAGWGMGRELPIRRIGRMCYECSSVKNRPP